MALTVTTPGFHCFSRSLRPPLRFLLPHTCEEEIREGSNVIGGRGSEGKREIAIEESLAAASVRTAVGSGPPGAGPGAPRRSTRWPDRRQSRARVSASASVPTHQSGTGHHATVTAGRGAAGRRPRAAGRAGLRTLAPRASAGAGRAPAWPGSARSAIWSPAGPPSRAREGDLLAFCRRSSAASSTALGLRCRAKRSRCGPASAGLRLGARPGCDRRWDRPGDRRRSGAPTLRAVFPTPPAPASRCGGRSSADLVEHGVEHGEAECLGLGAGEHMPEEPGPGSLNEGYTAIHMAAASSSKRTRWICSRTATARSAAARTPVRPPGRLPRTAAPRPPHQRPQVGSANRWASSVAVRSCTRPYTRVMWPMRLMWAPVARAAAFSPASRGHPGPRHPARRD